MEILWGEEARRSHRASALRPMGEIRSLGRRAAGGIHFRRGCVIPKGVPDVYKRQNAYNRTTAKIPQEYHSAAAQRGTPRLEASRDRGVKRQRRSGDGNIHGALPVPGAGRKERSPASGEAPFELGWHHEANFRSRPNGRDGSVLFCAGMGIFPNQAGSVEKRRPKPTIPRRFRRFAPPRGTSTGFPPASYQQRSFPPCPK